MGQKRYLGSIWDELDFEAMGGVVNIRNKIQF